MAIPGTRKPLDKQYRFASLGIDLCPVCGEEVCIIGKTKDERLIGSCGDAFSIARWNDEEECLFLKGEEDA